MPGTKVRSLEHGIQATNEWFHEVADELGTEDRRYAYRALRAYLHAVRDRLAVDEAAQLAAQMPDLLRGIYYEGWNPSATPAGYRRESEFLQRVVAEGGYAGTTEAGVAVQAAAAVVRRRISVGELSDVAAELPAELATLVTG